MKKYILPLSILLFLASVTFSIQTIYASYITDNGTVIVPGITGQLLFNNNGVLGAVPSSFASTTNGAVSNVNFGLFSNYNNPNGMLNLYTEATNTPILSSSFMGSTSSYVQTFMQNLNPLGSADLVFADDRGSATSTTHYFDIGIANSRQTDSDHTLILPFDSYIYSQTGRVIIGSSATTTASSSVVLSVGMQSTSPSFSIDQYGHVLTKGAAPTALSGCGTGPSVAGNDANGVISTGTGLSITSCSMTFKNPYPTGSNVTCSISTNSTLIQPAVTAVSTTGFTVGLSLNLASGKIYYQCMASQ